MLIAHNGGKGFTDVSKESGVIFEKPLVARGLAIGDLDNDGRLDAVVTTNDGAPYVLRNETPGGNHWLLPKLVGHKSNRDAIGAEELVTKNSAQYAAVSTASSCSPQATSAFILDLERNAQRTSKFAGRAEPDRHSRM
jgi:hypothetical protein